jgi:hypothetical protein
MGEVEARLDRLSLTQTDIKKGFYQENPDPPHDSNDAKETK